MDEQNGEKDKLRRQLEKREDEIRRLQDEKLQAISERVEENRQWCKSNFTGFDERLRAIEQANAYLVGQRALYGRIVPIAALAVSIAVAILKLVEMLR